MKIVKHYWFIAIALITMISFSFVNIQLRD